MAATAAVATVATGLLVHTDQTAKKAQRAAKREAGHQAVQAQRQERALAEQNKKSEIMQATRQQRQRQKALAAGAMGKRSTILSTEPASQSASSGYGGGSKTLLGG